MTRQLGPGASEQISLRSAKLCRVQTQVRPTHPINETGRCSPSMQARTWCLRCMSPCAVATPPSPQHFGLARRVFLTDHLGRPRDGKGGAEASAALRAGAATFPVAFSGRLPSAHACEALLLPMFHRRENCALRRCFLRLSHRCQVHRYHHPSLIRWHTGCRRQKPDFVKMSPPRVKSSWSTRT